MSFKIQNQPCFYGFRDLANNVVNKPILNVFRILGMMKGKRLKVNGDQMYTLKTVADSSIRGRNTDIGALAAVDKKEMTVLLWNYHDDDLHDTGKTVNVRIEHLPSTFVKLTQYRIDDE